MLGESNSITTDAGEGSGFDRSGIVAAARRLITAIAPMPASVPASVNALQAQAFPASADQLAGVRQMVWDMAAGHASRGAATLLSGELAANAIEHGGSGFFALALGRLPGDLVRLLVLDDGRERFPHLCAGSSPDGRGRGLRLVDALALRWGIIRRAPAGVAVWFETGCRLAAPLTAGRER